MSETLSSSTSLSPFFRFWKDRLGLIMKNATTGVEAELSTNNNDDSEVVTVKRPDYSVVSQDKSIVELLLRIARSKQLNYNLQTRSWNWGFISGWSELIFHQILTDHHQLPKIYLQTEYHEHIVLDANDGGSICMHIYYPGNLIKRNLPTNPALLLFPSLSSNQESFTPLIEHVTQEKEWTVVVVNRRGLCERLKTPEFFVMGNDDDTYTLLTHLHKMQYFQGRPVYALGLSMGGNCLLRYLCKLAQFSTEEKQQTLHIAAAATICSPIHPRDVRPVEKATHSRLCAALTRKYVTPYLDYFDKPILEDITKQTLLTQDEVDLTEFEFQYKKQLYLQLKHTTNAYEWMYVHLQLSIDPIEFESIQQSLLKESGIPLSQMLTQNDPRIWNAFREYKFDIDLVKIDIPFVCIFAQDDPLVQLTPESRDYILKNKSAAILLAKAGSHVYFRNSFLDLSTSWAESIVYSYFEAK